MQTSPLIPDSGDTVGDLLNDFGVLSAQYRDCAGHLTDLQNWIKRREGTATQQVIEGGLR